MASEGATPGLSVYLTDTQSTLVHPPTSEPTSSASGDMTLSPSSARRRATSKSTALSSSLKRAASSPNVRSVSHAEMGGMTLAEKRRNKLGYHRTSVACGHCRRRKIRCLLAPEDPAGKCQNCIRLKKDCNFYPVDQQPISERRPRSDSNKAEASSNEAGTSNSSSPGFNGGRLIEQLDNPQQRLPRPPLSASHPSTFSHLGASMSSSAGRVPQLSRGFEYPQIYESNTGWEVGSPFYSRSPQGLNFDKSAGDEMSNERWKSNGSQILSNYPPSQYPITPTSMSMSLPLHESAENFALPEHKSEHNIWPRPQGVARSMSLNTPEDLSMHYQPHYYSNTPIDFGSRTTIAEMQPPGVPRSTGSLTSLSDQQTYQPPHSEHASYTSPWSTMQQSQSPLLVSSASEGFAQTWYSESPRLAQVREEEHGQPFHQPHHSARLGFQRFKSGNG